MECTASTWTHAILVIVEVFHSTFGDEGNDEDSPWIHSSPIMFPNPIADNAPVVCVVAVPAAFCV
eukprot:m.324194 g.324194  ORF g.324194 m.324194 type:complete len:65 (+) comp20370_c0_seq2:195-389(+)